MHMHQSRFPPLIDADHPQFSDKDHAKHGAWKHKPKPHKEPRGYLVVVGVAFVVAGLLLVGLAG